MKLPDNPDVGTVEDFVREKFRIARQFIEDAKEAHNRESNNTAVNRAYYALFKVVTAVQTLDKKKVSESWASHWEFQLRIYPPARYLSGNIWRKIVRRDALASQE